MMQGQFSCYFATPHLNGYGIDTLLHTNSYKGAVYGTGNYQWTLY
jgi:hypothetical protein